MARLQHYNYGGNFINALRAGQQDRQQQQFQDFRQGLMQQQQDFKEQQAPIKNELESRRIGVSERGTAVDESKQQMAGLEYLGKVANNLMKYDDQMMPRAYAGMRGQLEQITGQKLPENITRQELQQFSALVEQEKAKYSKPFDAVNASGQDVLLQTDQYGNARELQGYRPAQKQPLVQVNTGGKQDTKFQEAMGKKDADRFAEVESQYQNALQVEQQVGELEKLASEFTTGRMTPLMAEVSALWGGDLASAKQAFDANANQMVLAAAESLKGVLSDRDIDILKSTAVSASNTPEANERILSIIKKGIDLKKRQYQNMTQYVEQNNTLRGYRGQQLQQPQEQQNQPMTATNPQTGQKIQFVNGQWVPANE
mgnify:CR=1 FL=1